MTQYDAGPGDWSDRPWEDPDKKPKPQARRRRVTLPPWALLAILVGIIILLCVGLVLIVQAIRGDRDGEATATPSPTTTAALLPTETLPPPGPTEPISPTATVVLPGGTVEPTAPPTEIGPGALVVISGTAGAGLNLRAEPGRQAQIIVNAREGTVLTVVEGPRQADDLVWWKVRTPDNQEGWGAANWLTLKTE